MPSLTDIRPADLGHAIEIADRVYWVGHYRPEDPFQCHVYLLEQGDQSVLIDPGSILTFDETRRKIAEVIDFAQIRWFICHHQDPDITAALGTIDRMVTRDDAVLVTHWRAQMLLQHYGLRRLPFWRVEENGWALQAGTHSLRFVFTPYLHFPGAFCTFDEETAVLFSSDLFGGYCDDWALVARGESYFEDIRTFHEHYMPSRDILVHALEKLERLPIQIIAPQHGSLITGTLVPFMIERLKSLDCGIYLMAENDTSVRRLVELNRALHDLTQTLLSSRDFGSMVRELRKIVQRLIPVTSLDLYLQRDRRSTLVFSEATNYRGVESPMPVPAPSALQLASAGGRLSPTTPEAGPTLVVPLDSHGFGSAFAVLQLSRAAEDGEALERIVQQINAPLSMALEREWIQRQTEFEQQELYER